jgi:hypothetical protein
VLDNGSTLLAAFVTGIMAGFFWAYTFNVNLAMLEVSGQTYAIVQSLSSIFLRPTSTIASQLHPIL